jgi:hypothetical protein
MKVLRVLATYCGLTIKVIAFSCLSICLLGAAQTAYGQTVNVSLTKPQALKTVKVSSVKDWKEVISDKCRFRVLFPSEPTLKPSDEVVPLLEGYKLIKDETQWAAQYVEFDEAKTDDEQLLREAYRGSAEGMAKNRGRLLKQSDVILNGRLGTEFIIEERDTATYMRAFLIGQRMYTLTVVRKMAAPGSSTFPQDVQQFFDSFTFWD